MLRSAIGKAQTSAVRSCPLLVFSVGGRRLAVKTDEVASVSQWSGSIPVPSRTPYISAVVRRDEEVLPVYDLAAQLHVSPRGEELLCVTAKHPRGAVAICIDEDMPVLHSLESEGMRPYRGDVDCEAVGSFVSGLDEIPIISFAKLGTTHAQGLRNTR